MTESPVIHCAGDDCAASVPNHRWGKTKAEGWFFQKDGTAWCPDHLPDWVETWRERRVPRGVTPAEHPEETTTAEGAP